MPRVQFIRPYTFEEFDAMTKQRMAAFPEDTPEFVILAVMMTELSVALSLHQDELLLPAPFKKLIPQLRQMATVMVKLCQEGVEVETEALH